MKELLEIKLENIKIEKEELVKEFYHKMDLIEIKEQVYNELLEEIKCEEKPTEDVESQEEPTIMVDSNCTEEPATY